MGSKVHQAKEEAAGQAPRLDHLDLERFKSVKVIQEEELAARDLKDLQGFDSGMVRS